MEAIAPQARWARVKGQGDKVIEEGSPRSKGQGEGAIERDSAQAGQRYVGKQRLAHLTHLDSCHGGQGVTDLWKKAVSVLSPRKSW